VLLLYVVLLYLLYVVLLYLLYVVLLYLLYVLHLYVLLLYLLYVLYISMQKFTKHIKTQTNLKRKWLNVYKRVCTCHCL